VLCSRCSTNLPDGSQFCLKCGQKVDLAANSIELATIPAQFTCGKCGTNLHRSAQFCLKCGQPVISTADSAALAPVAASGLEGPQPLRARRQGGIILWLLVLVLLGAVLWAATSESPAAQQVQEFVGWSHAQTIEDAEVSVNPRRFLSYEFTVPPGALKVSVTGEFSAAAGPPRNGNSNEGGKDRDTGIEAFVLTDAAFVVWSNGYSAQTQYESGPVAGATINAPLPAGAGVYHLIFSNKISPRAKTIHATVLLRYKSWLPDAVVHLRDRFWNWIGL
jgi:hypothetical protein